MSDTLTRSRSGSSPAAGSPPARGRYLVPLALVVGLALLLVAPIYVSTGYLQAGEYVMIGSVGAIGLTLLTGQAGQLSLAHGFFLLAGGTSYCVLAGERGSSELIGFGLPPLLALIGAVLIPAALGLAFAPVAGRLRGIYLGIASFSLVFIGLYVGQRFDGLTGGTASGRSPTTFSLFGFSFGSSDPDLFVLGVPFDRAERTWYLFLVLAVIAYVLARGAVRSRPGRAWRAVRDNDTAAAVMGVNVVRAKAGAFAVSSGFAGLAGAMTVLWLTILKPDESEFGTYGINASIAFLAMVIIGGLGSVPGPWSARCSSTACRRCSPWPPRVPTCSPPPEVAAHPGDPDPVHLRRRDRRPRAVRTPRSGRRRTPSAGLDRRPPIHPHCRRRRVVGDPEDGDRP